MDMAKSFFSVSSIISVVRKKKTIRIYPVILSKRKKNMSDGLLIFILSKKEKNISDGIYRIYRIF